MVNRYWASSLAENLLVEMIEFITEGLYRADPYTPCRTWVGIPTLPRIRRLLSHSGSLICFVTYPDYPSKYVTLKKDGETGKYSRSGKTNHRTRRLRRPACTRKSLG